MEAVSQRQSLRPPISAAIICFNEERNIARCLDALQWCDEIVVVDSGSKDFTLDIVRQYPQVRVFHRPFDNYIDQKNFAVDKCGHDWILSIDADEVLTLPLIEEIQRLSFDVDGYYIGRRTFLGEQEIKHGTWCPDFNLRLFHRDLGRWGGSNPHERVVLAGTTARLRTRMLHFSFRSRAEFLERNLRYTHMLVQHMARQGRAPKVGQQWIHFCGNFLKSYVLKAGFLDGEAGLFLAWHIANFSRLKYQLLAEELSARNQSVKEQRRAA